MILGEGLNLLREKVEESLAVSPRERVLHISDPNPKKKKKKVFPNVFEGNPWVSKRYKLYKSRPVISPCHSSMQPVQPELSDALKFKLPKQTVPS